MNRKDMNLLEALRDIRERHADGEHLRDTNPHGPWVMGICHHFVSDYSFTLWEEFAPLYRAWPAAVPGSYAYPVAGNNSSDGHWTEDTKHGRRRLSLLNWAIATLEARERSNGGAE